MTARRLTLGVLILVCGFLAGLVVTGRLRETSDAGAQPPSPAIAAPAGAAGASLTDFTRIAERTVPAVVNISAQQVVRQQFYDPLAEFFGGTGLRYRRGVENSVGSGVIISDDGYILTNNHVVTGEASSPQLTIEQLDISVALSDQRELEAEVIGVDPATDLALLKIDARNLPTVPWGDSTKLKVAEWVLAIGNPFQLSQTVTLGIVSAVGRTNLGVTTYEDFVQTDAAINPGNSGGALINARGELVGINTVIFSRSGGYQGIGFAVSSNLARRVFADLRDHGEVRRGSVGAVRFVPLTTQFAEQLGVDGTKGALVYEIARNSAAFQAGVQAGDVVVGFNGTAVTDPGHLERLLSDAPIGSTATLRVVREGRPVDVRVQVQRRQRNAPVVR